jgi:hypothetical protein
MANTWDGGCACGAVRYRLAGAPMFVHCCHCTECQRRTGSAFAINGPIEADRVTILAGEDAVMGLLPHDGGTPGVVACGRCGVVLWFHHRLWKERIKLVAIGTLDDARAFPPRAHCFVRSKHPWVGLPADAIAADELFDMAGAWTPDEMGRLAAALARD